MWHDDDQWVQVERYIRSEIQDLGGSTKANAHVRLPDGRTLKVTVDHDVLRDDSVNRLYKQAMLRIRAGLSGYLGLASSTDRESTAILAGALRRFLGSAI